MMRATSLLLVVFGASLGVGCAKKAPALSAEDRESAMGAAKQCTDAVQSLAPSYQMVGPRLAQALKMDRTEAQRLMRDSIELLISTRELLCNVSVVTVDGVLEKAPSDEQTVAARKRMKTALDKLATVRATYDKLLGAASSADAPVDQDALLERFSKALVGQ
jgi:hypothetical protein